MYPNREEALDLLKEAEKLNPGPWGNHSRTVAHCAERIAALSSMNPDKAYVLGLLHDIGRRFGKRHLGHVSDGYTYMMSLGYDDVARICLTHSFNEQKIEGYVGNFDTTEEKTNVIKMKLREVQFDEYDKLIQLCDAISGAEGVMNIVDRMNDVRMRYGAYDLDKWNTNLALKDYFEKKMGKDLYEAVEKDSFKESALDFIIDALQYIVSIQDGNDRDKKYAALASSVNSGRNTKVYAVVKQEIKDLMKLSNEYFDIRHNDCLNDAKEKREPLNDSQFIEYLYNRAYALLYLLRLKVKVNDDIGDFT